MTTAEIQQLREQTGVGMMDAKRALEAVGGDMKAAIEHLRKAGQKIAASKSARTVKEGSIGVWVAEDGSRGAMVAVACETDFVARTDSFQAFVRQLAQVLGQHGTPTTTVEQFLEMPGVDGAATVKVSLESAIATLGENMQIPSLAVVEADGGAVDMYLHASKKVAALVALNRAQAEVSHDVAMHVAALGPKYLAPQDVPADVVATEEGIYREQLSREGKPEAMWEKILPGKVKKFYADVCLTDQLFIKDDSMTVAAYLKNAGDLRVTNFARLAI